MKAKDNDLLPKRDEKSYQKQRHNCILARKYEQKEARRQYEKNGDDADVRSSTASVSEELFAYSLIHVGKTDTLPRRIVF